MLPLRVWVHCPRASNGLLPPRSNLVGYMRWHARSDSVLIPPSDNHSNSFQFANGQPFRNPVREGLPTIHESGADGPAKPRFLFSLKILVRIIMQTNIQTSRGIVTSVSSQRSNCNYTAGHGGSSSLTHCCGYWRGVSLALEVVAERTRQC